MHVGEMMCEFVKKCQLIVTFKIELYVLYHMYVDFEVLNFDDCFLW
jgi:hypothetical protein